MSLDDEIKNRFLTDSKTILEAHLDDLEGMFHFHEDDTIELFREYREMQPENTILLYLIARRYQFEGGLVENDSMTYGEIYPVFPEKGDSTVRGYLMNLREAGYARKSNEGHTLIAERLPEAIERIEAEVSDQ